jgi:hypothetical protein
MLELLLSVGDSPVGPGTGVDVQIGAGQTLFGGAVSALFTTLVVGAILIALFPDYTERTIEDIFTDPIGRFLYGIAVLLLLGVLIVLLVISIIGILVVIPLVLLAILVWAAGASLVLLAIADRLVGHEDGWIPALFVAAGINAALALSGVGAIVSIVLGALGFGTILSERSG